MAWPFSTVVQPNVDTTPGQAVPNVATAVFTGALWMLGAHFSNPSVTQITVTVTDTAGDLLCIVTLPPGAEQPYEWPFRPTNGVKWSGDSVGATGHIWGYQ